jgi:hypothetical protein
MFLFSNPRPIKTIKSIKIMKTISLSILLALLVCNATFAQKQDRFIVLTSFSGPSLARRYLFIGSNRAKVDKAYRNAKYRDGRNESWDKEITEFFKELRYHKHYVSKPLEQYIVQYINDNCFRHITSGEDLQYYDKVFYLIEATDGNGHGKTCQLINQEEAVKYFTGIKEWLEKSKYKSQCTYLIGDISAYITETEFPLTRVQEWKLKTYLDIQKRTNPSKNKK